MDYEEFSAYAAQVRVKFQEYKEQVENSETDIIEGLDNMEFIFRFEMMDHVLDELSDMERLINE